MVRHMPPIPSRPVSGRYRGRNDRFEVELRVDVDGPRTTHRISADYYDGDSYRGSMRVDAPSVEVGADRVTISGRGTFSWPTRFQSVHVSVSRRDGAPATATLCTQHPRRRHGCRVRLPVSRAELSQRAILEEGVQRGVERFESYDTAALPSGGPAAHALGSCRVRGGRHRAGERRGADRGPASRPPAPTARGATRSCTPRWSSTSAASPTGRNGRSGCCTPGLHDDPNLAGSCSTAAGVNARAARSSTSRSPAPTRQDGSQPAARVHARARARLQPHALLAAVAGHGLRCRAARTRRRG